MKFIIAFTWALSLVGAIFLGHEFALMNSDKEVTYVKVKNEQCLKVMAGIE